MKNVEEGENVGARFASFFMAAQPLLHIREANASLKGENIGNHKRISANSNFGFVMLRIGSFCK